MPIGGRTGEILSSPGRQGGQHSARSDASAQHSDSLQRFPMAEVMFVIQ